MRSIWLRFMKWLYYDEWNYFSDSDEWEKNEACGINNNYIVYKNE